MKEFDGFTKKDMDRIISKWDKEIESTKRVFLNDEKLAKPRLFTEEKKHQIIFLKVTKKILSSLIPTEIL